MTIKCLIKISNEWKLKTFKVDEYVKILSKEQKTFWFKDYKQYYKEIDVSDCQLFELIPDNKQIKLFFIINNANMEIIDSIIRNFKLFFNKYYGFNKIEYNLNYYNNTYRLIFYNIYTYLKRMKDVLNLFLSEYNYDNFDKNAYDDNKIISINQKNEKYKLIKSDDISEKLLIIESILQYNYDILQRYSIK